MQTLNQPTKQVPYYHYVCKCGKPVENSKAWFVNGMQQHYSCTKEPQCK